MPKGIPDRTLSSASLYPQNYVRENIDELNKTLKRYNADLPPEIQAELDDAEKADSEEIIPALPLRVYLDVFLAGKDCPAKFAFYEICAEENYETVGAVLIALEEKDKAIDRTMAQYFLREGSASGLEKEALKAYFAKSRKISRPVRIRRKF